MCTLTWWPAANGYDFFFNRDELDTRAPELPPQASRVEGVGFLAPRDGSHGGTWLAVNEYGLTAALLNDYAASWHPSGVRRSRGALVLACAPADSLDAVEAVVRAEELAALRPFTLVAIDARAMPLAAHWDGEQLRVARGADVPGFFSSSSFRTAEVIEHRSRLYGELVRSGGRPTLMEVEAYHHRHDASAGAYSVCMRRPDAATRSITHVSVRDDGVELIYEPQPRLGRVRPTGQRCQLPRRHAGRSVGASE